MEEITDNKANKTKYKQLIREIKYLIFSGQIIKEGKLPSEIEITKRFDVSRHTVRHALAILEREGLLYKIKGKGTYISEKKKRQHDPKTIALLCTNLSNSVSPLIIKGVEQTLSNQGYNLIISSTNNNKHTEKEQLKNLMMKPINGLIIEPTKSAENNRNLKMYLELKKNKIPFLMINEKYLDLDCPCIKMNDEVGGYIATKHLIELGHRRIAGFFKTDDLQGVHRLKGYIKAHLEYNVDINPELTFSFSSVNEDLNNLKTIHIMLEKINRPTAIVSYNDELTIKLLDVIRKLGLKIPDDISIVSFGDSLLSTAAEVKLTTLKQLNIEMGVTAAEMLLKMIKKNRISLNKDILFNHELIVRDSTSLYKNF